MRVCILTNNTRPDNGWGRFARELIAALRSEGTDVVILSEEPGGYADEHVVLTNSLRFSLASFAKSLLHLPVLLYNTLRARKFIKECDLIHALDGYPYGAIGAMASFSSGIPFVITLQGTYSLDAFYHVLERKFLTWALGHARKIICISSYVAREIKKYVPGITTEVIGHGTALLWVSGPRSLSGPLVPKPYVLGVGTVKPQKGYQVSLPAFAQAKKKFPDLSYAIVGYQKHEFFAGVKNMARDLGVERAVYFFSDMPETDLLNLYDHAELFLLTPVSMGSAVEGFGLVYREAGARGLAVVGSRDCGAEDAVQDGVTGILCPQGDVNAVATAMKRLLADKEFRARMGKAGHRLARQESWTLAAKRYKTIYDAAIRQ